MTWWCRPRISWSGRSRPACSRSSIGASSRISEMSGRTLPRGLSTYDPGNLYAVNYMWGTTGIGFNVKKLREILGPDAKVDSWDMVFKPENLAKFKACGVMMLDSSDDILPAALRYLGLDPNTKDAADLEKAADLVAKVRPSVRKFHSSEYHQLAVVAAKSVSWSAGRATSSRRRSAASRPRAASISATRSRKKARRCGSTISRSRRMRRMSRRRMNSSITCCGRTRPRAIPISSPMPTAISRARS